ncbi:MAG TPA: hypothetical protein ENG92_02175 [Thiolapillus brandeum]|uniref:Uncharacterized protein n=1 Tax=Thiolapillus brandeum TaxID=1076588 RepID=A0A831NYT2_9GAMM|nr:hypothetical protein [Thiolapillus brandeum]
MHRITTLSKQPPGGRCTLYIRYAEAASRHPAISHEVKYKETDEESPPAPSMLIDGQVIEPSDGVILSPEDVVHGLKEKMPDKELDDLRSALETVQECLMEEWTNG